MAGDPSNSSIWPEADVYVAPLGTALPATAEDAFPVGWELVGFLDGDAGFAHSRSVDKKDFFEWAGGLVRQSRRNFKATTKFTLLEDNDVTRSLIWPGSTADELITPVPERILIGFETREGDIVARHISKYQAEVDVDGDIVDKPDDLTKYPMIATIFPDSDGVLFTRQKTELGS